MSQAELLYGMRERDDFPCTIDLLRSRDAAVVELADVEIFYSLFELPMSVAIARLPRSLHPSIPAVMGINFWRVPTSPFGEFNLAYVGLACRTGIKPRHLVIGAWCDNPSAAQFFSDRYGFNCRLAEVRCRESYERVVGQIAVGGVTIVETLASEFVPIVGGGGTVKYSPPLNLAKIDGRAMFAQFEATYAFKRVSRGVVENEIYRAIEVGDGAIEPTTPIAGTFAVCDVQLLPIRFQVDLAISAEDGGATKIAAI